MCSFLTPVAMNDLRDFGRDKARPSQIAYNPPNLRIIRRAELRRGRAFPLPLYSNHIASAMTGGMVRMLRSVVPLTSPTERSTSLPNFDENIETIAATGADAATTMASIISLGRCARRRYSPPSAARTGETGITTPRSSPSRSKMSLGLTLIST